MTADPAATVGHRLPWAALGVLSPTDRCASRMLPTGGWSCFQRLSILCLERQTQDVPTQGLFDGMRLVDE